MYRVHSLDVRTGERHQVSHEPVGLVFGDISADGEWVVWHRDTTGDESGTFVAAPFGGGEGEPLVDGLPVAWDQGVALGRHRTLAAVSDRSGFAVYAAEGGAPARLLSRHDESIELGGANAMVSGGVEIGGLSGRETPARPHPAGPGHPVHPAPPLIHAPPRPAPPDPPR